MANVKVGWGKCVIVGGGSTLTTSEINNALASNASGIILPIEGTTQLTTQEGERLDAKLEGGEIAAIRYGADTYVLEFAVWTKDEAREYADALKSKAYIYIVPEDAVNSNDAYALGNVKLVKSTITGNSTDGFRTNYRIEANTII